MTAATHPTAPTSDSRVFRPFARWVVAHRAAVIVAILAITAFLLTRIGTLQLDNNPDSWAPQNHAYVATTRLLKEVFGGTNVVIIGITPKQGDIYQPEVLAKIQRIQEGIEQIPHAVRHNVVSLASRRVKHIEGGPEGMEVRQMLETVPRTPAGIERLKAAVASMPIYINSLVSPEGKSAAIYLLYRFREELARSGNVLPATRDSLLTSGKAVLFVAISIIGGYAVLQFSDFAFFNQISNMVMATMAVSAFFALFFLRALMMIFKPRFVFGYRRDVVLGAMAPAGGGGQ